MEMKVRCTDPTIKILAQVQRQGWREGDTRVIRRTQALLELGTGRPVAARLGLHLKSYRIEPRKRHQDRGSTFRSSFGRAGQGPDLCWSNSTAR